MTYLLIALICVTAGLGLLVRGYHLQQRGSRQANSYRRRYIQLVAHIELAVIKLNSLANLVPHVAHGKTLDDYEACLRLMESLLSALNRLPNFGFDAQHLVEASPMVRRVEEKIEETYRRFKTSIEDKPLLQGLLQRWKEETSPPVSGCYFCSRPFMRAYFKGTTIKVDGISLKVFACHICLAELKSKRKVRVLYFIENGQPVHWTLSKDYEPLEQYWNLNRRKASYRKPEVEWQADEAGRGDEAGKE
jgi:hypothetical protein